MNKYLEQYLKIFESNPQIQHKIINKYNQDLFFLLYNSEMIDKKLFYNILLDELNDVIKSNNYDLLKSSLLEIEEVNKFDIFNIENIIYSGNILIYSYKNDMLYKLNLAFFVNRTPSLDSQDVVYGGSKDNLIESIDTNVTLLYKRIKSSYLINDCYSIGNLSKTRLSLLYLKNKCDNKLIKEIHKRLTSIDCDAITSIGNLSTYLFNKTNLIPLMTYTSKVDLLEQALLSGKVVIIMDGIPEGIILPITLFNFGSLDDAINEGIVVTFFSKLFSLIGIFISLFLLGLYTSIILYEPDLIPYKILTNVYNSYKGIALSSELELIIAYIFFQIFLHAGNKSLSGLSGAILIIGSLLIGQVSISSGFISQTTLIIVAISLFSCFIISNNISLNTSFMFLQLINFISSLLFGFLGYLVSMLIIIIYLNSLESFTTPFLYPFSHFNLKKIKEALFSSNYLNKKGKKKWKRY